MTLSTWLARWICRRYHGTPLTPIRGFYRCAKCLRLYEVPWEHDSAQYEKPKARVQTGIERHWNEAADEVSELEKLYRR